MSDIKHSRYAQEYEIPESVYMAIEDRLSGGIPHQLVLSYPKGQVGLLYKIYEDRIADVLPSSVFDHPNVIKDEVKL